LWGVGEGLPYVFNADEGDHFVPKAVEMFQHGSLNPHYFANPPAFTYLLHYLFAVWYGGGSGALSALRLHPGDLYTLARVAAAVLGTLAPWLLFTGGARLLSPGDAAAARERGSAAQRARARLPAGRRRAGPGVRHQVHGRDRAPAPGRRDRSGLPGTWARRAGTHACRDRRRGSRRAGRVPDRKPLRAARLP